MPDAAESTTDYLVVFGREAATEVNRPAGGRWSWSPPIQAIAQDGYKFRHLHPARWTNFLELCEGMIGNLYDQGFRIAKGVDPESTPFEQLRLMCERGQSQGRNILELFDIQDVDPNDDDHMYVIEEMCRLVARIMRPVLGET
jgi:hypothetical protein